MFNVTIDLTRVPHSDISGNAQRTLSSTDEETVWNGEPKLDVPDAATTMFVKGDSDNDWAKTRQLASVTVGGDVQPAVKDKVTSTVGEHVVPGDVARLSIDVVNYDYTVRDALKDKWTYMMPADLDASFGFAGFGIDGTGYTLATHGGVTEFWSGAAGGPVTIGDLARITINERPYDYTVCAAAKDKRTFEIVGDGGAFAVNDEFTAHLDSDWLYTVAPGDTDEDIAVGLAAAAADDAAWDVSAEGRVLTVEAKVAGAIAAPTVTTSGVCPIVATQTRFGKDADTNPADVVAGLARAAAGDPEMALTTDGAEIDAESFAFSIMMTIVAEYVSAADEGSTLSMTRQRFAAEPSTAELFAAELAELAVADPLYDVTSEGASVIVEAKTAGVRTVTVEAEAQFAAVLTNTVIGRNADDFAAVAAGIAALAAADPLYNVTADSADVVSEAKVAGATETEVSSQYVEGGSEGTSFESVHTTPGVDGDIARVATGLLEAIPDIVTGTLHDTAENDNYAIVVGPIESPENVYQYVATAEDTPATAAGHLADAGNAMGGNAKWLFVANGPDVIATHRTPGATADVITFMAGPGNATAAHTQTGADAAVDPEVYEHTVVEGDTLETIASALCDRFNAQTLFDATIDGGDATKVLTLLRQPGADQLLYDLTVNNQSSEGPLQCAVNLETQAKNGSGLQKVQISGRLADGSIGTEIVALAGTNAVETSNAYTDIVEMVAVEVGSGGKAAGVVGLTNESADKTYATIAQNETVCGLSLYVVPQGHVLVIDSVWSNPGVGTPLVKLRSTQNPLSTGEDASGGYVWHEIYPGPAAPVRLGPFRAGQRVWMSAKGAQNDTVSCGWTGGLVRASLL